VVRLHGRCTHAASLAVVRQGRPQYDRRREEAAGAPARLARGGLRGRRRRHAIQGTSAAGLNFELTFYPSVEDAKAHLGKKKVRVENAVFDYGFQGAQNVGVAASTAVLGSETKTIEHCLAEARR
jgi:hypothetical protein